MHAEDGRSRRWNHVDREKKKARAKRHFRKLQQDPRRRAARNEYFRDLMAARRAHLAGLPAELSNATNSIVSAGSLKNPRFLWLDTNGNLHIEEELSAEELIRAWEEACK
jgi:hypothetical protein